MIKNYLIITLKVLARRKFFTFVSLFGISFTLMILMVATAFLDHSFTAMAPESKFDRVMVANMFRMRSPDNESNWTSPGSYYLIDHYLRPLKEYSNGALEELSIFTHQSATHTFKNGEKISFKLRHVDGAYFRIVDLQFVEGNPFTDEDDKARNFVAVVSEAFQKSYFNGASAMGQTFTFNSKSYKVVGVVKNVSETRETAFADVWVPNSTDKNTQFNAAPLSNSEIMGDYLCAFLCRNESDMLGIKLAVAEMLKNVQFPDPKEYDKIQTRPRTAFERTAVQWFFDWETMFTHEQTGKLRLAIILGAFLFMLLPSLNLVNLNLSRMMERATEIGVRRSFGASISVLVKQFIVENVFISLIGGILGILLSQLALYVLNSSEYFANANFAINYRVLLMGIVLSVLFGVFSGAYPAWRMARINPVYALKGGSK